jgi:prophage regulatory protein
MVQTLPTLLRLPSVLAARGVRKTQHYDDIKNGLFPHPIKIGQRASAWKADEVAAINSARIAGKSEEEIKKLVAELEAARTADKEA